MYSDNLAATRKEWSPFCLQSKFFRSKRIKMSLPTITINH
nr:MAG TPA_asm: hypothetical protein [Caudoviricetes sp.]